MTKCMKTHLITKAAIPVLSLIAWLLTPQTGRCFYNPSTGRWLSRDPVQEDGFLVLLSDRSDYEVDQEQNLYCFVSNDSLSHYDNLGLVASPCANPCADAKRQGLDNGNVGGVVCCGGKKYACVWISGGATHATNKKAKSIIDKCSSVHEKHHFGDINCPCSSGVTRPGFKPGKDPNTQECAAYKAEVACLKQSLGDCMGNKQCKAQVQAEIDSDNRQMKKLCP